MAAPTWQDSYKLFQADHQRKFGVDMNRPWTADADATAAKQQIDASYRQALADYNKVNGTNEQADAAALGANAQPNTFTPTDHSGDGFLGGFRKAASNFLSPASLLSGGITAINDTVMDAAGTSKGNTFYALNDALKHGPIESSIEKGRPSNVRELWSDRNERLGADSSGWARGIGDLAGIAGLAYGGAALAGTGAGATGGAATAGGGAMGPAADFGAWTYGGGATPGSMAMPALAGSMPAGVTGFESMIPVAGAAPGAWATPGAAAGTAGGATAIGTGAQIGSGTAAEGAAAMGGSSPWDSLLKQGVKSLIGGGLNSALSRQGQGAAQDAADPFHSQRAQYQPQLQAMMQGQFSPTDPSYDWRFQQGEKATNRAAAASGMGLSGNRLQALTQYGQGMASTEYQHQFNRLAQLSGANFGTSNAGNIAANQQAGNQAATTAAVGGLMDWGSKLYDTWNTPDAGTSAPDPNMIGINHYSDNAILPWTN